MENKPNYIHTTNIAKLLPNEQENETPKIK